MNDNNKQCIVLENKSTLKITGIDNVINLTETDACVTIKGEKLEIKGLNLQAEKLSVESGELIINGNIISLKYKEDKEKKPLLKRIFK